MTKPIIKRQRAELFAKQGGRCCYCDGATWLRGTEQWKHAAARLSVPQNQPHSRTLMRYAAATFEHAKRIADGGKHNGNGMMACAFCNVSRDNATIDENRTDMQALVAAGLHPVNRPIGPLDNIAAVRKNALRALRRIRTGNPPT